MPKWRAWPLLLGLVAIVVWDLPVSDGAAEEKAAKEKISQSEEASAEKSQESRRHSLTRYESLWQRSLFHAPVQAAVADPAFAKDYSLAGIFEMDGKTMAALVRKRDGVVINVSNADDAAAGSDGLRLISVETTGGTKGTKVQVEKSGIRAWIVATPVMSSQANAPSAPMASPARSSAADTTEFSDWENFPGAPGGVSSPEMPSQNDGVSGATPPADPVETAAEILVSRAPSVKQPVPVPVPPSPPSPLDAAVAADEKEIVVPIEK